MALKVLWNAPYKMLCEKAVEKWKAYHSNLYEEDEEYVLLLDKCKVAIFLPGPAKDFFPWNDTRKKWVKILRELCTFVQTRIFIDQKMSILAGVILRTMMIKIQLLQQRTVHPQNV